MAARSKPVWRRLLSFGPRRPSAADRLARLWNYFYTPDVLAEICAELGVPFRSNGYRFWHPEEA